MTRPDADGAANVHYYFWTPGHSLIGEHVWMAGVGCFEMTGPMGSGCGGVVAGDWREDGALDTLSTSSTSYSMSNANHVARFIMILPGR